MVTYTISETIIAKMVGKKLNIFKLSVEYISDDHCHDDEHDQYHDHDQDYNHEYCFLSYFKCWNGREKGKHPQIKCRIH